MSEADEPGVDFTADDPVVEVVVREALATGGVPEVVDVADDPEGLFAAAVLELGAREVRVFDDDGSEALPAGASAFGLERGWAADVELVVGRLPKTLAALDELGEVAAQFADPAVRVILGARQQHLVHSMNDALGQSFGSVRGSRGHRKSRALVATEPRAGLTPRYPLVGRIPELDLEVRAHGGAFAGAAYDLGTRALIDALDGVDLGDPAVVVDLGCGTGVLACASAREFPEARVIATDRAWSAVASAAATAAANGLEVEILRADAGAGIADGTVDLILCNPPFHDGRDVDPGMANRLFAAAARMLRPGGMIVTVFNSHLKHRQHLERIVGHTRQLDRTAKFTVTLTTRR